MVLPNPLRVVAILLAFTSCTNSSAPKTTLKEGQKVFQFTPAQVTELTLVKMDPNSGQNWSLRLIRNQEWTIAPERSAESFLDRQADSNFVNHLLDTLQTLQVVKAGLSTPKEALGLQQPIYALRWLEKTGPQPREFELHIGPAVGKAGEGFGSWTPNEPPFISRGAAHEMLAHMTQMDVVRKRTWAGVQADDIDEIEWRKNGKSILYAQREGADWTDRKHKKLKPDYSAWLEHLTRERIQTFLDDYPSSKDQIQSELQRLNPLDVVLKDRQGTETILKVAKKDGKWIGLSSARPGGVFEVYPDCEKAIQPPKL